MKRVLLLILAPAIISIACKDNKEQVEEKNFISVLSLIEQQVARFDELLNRVIISYLPLNPEKEEIQKQELFVTPNIATGDKVNTILISRVINNRDGYLQKEMLWQMDKSFQVVTTTQKPGEPEIITTTKVTWNENDDQWQVLNFNI